jgi:hypothetical protein
LPRNASIFALARERGRAVGSAFESDFEKRHFLLSLEYFFSISSRREKQLPVHGSESSKLHISNYKSSTQVGNLDVSETQNKKSACMLCPTHSIRQIGLQDFGRLVSHVGVPMILSFVSDVLFQRF